MRFLASSDLHVSDRLINNRSRLPVTLQVLKDMNTLARHHRVRYCIIVGDLWDKKQGTPRSVLNGLYKFFLRTKYQTDIKWILMGGNHEHPNNSDLSDTHLNLFSEVAHVVLKPKVLSFPDVDLYLLPWQPAPGMIKAAREFALKARAAGHKRRSILLAHVGLREGRIAASNVQIPQRVSITHMYPSIFDILAFGDYHSHQWLASNAFYMGAPIQHIFGDEGCEGPWLIDTTAMEVESQVLPTRAPIFQKWTVADAGDLTLVGYRPEDYNRIYAPVICHQSLRVLYPDASLKPLDVPRAGEVDLSNSRLSVTDIQNPSRLLDRFLKLRGKTAEEAKLLHKKGLELIGEVQ